MFVLIIQDLTDDFYSKEIILSLFKLYGCIFV